MRSRRERGQSTVEFALLVPLVVVAALAVVQVGVVAYAQLAVTHSAREAARTLVADPDADLAPVTQGALVDGNGLDVAVRIDAANGTESGSITVTVSHAVPVVSGLFAPFLADAVVRAEVRMLAQD